jgi:hypothetical protein
VTKLLEYIELLPRFARAPIDSTAWHNNFLPKQERFIYNFAHIFPALFGGVRDDCIVQQRGVYLYRIVFGSFPEAAPQMEGIHLQTRVEGNDNLRRSLLPAQPHLQALANG